MEINVKSKKNAQTSFPNGNGDPWALHNVQLYVLPPQEEVTLAELRELAVFRQKALNAVESAGLRYTKLSNDYKHALDNAFRQCDFKAATTAMSTLVDKAKASAIADKKNLEEDWIQYRRNDYLSHFVLRLAYCSTPDLRQWFIQQEVDLFRFRFSAESSHSAKQFLQLYGIPTELVEPGSKEWSEIEPIMQQLFPPNKSKPVVVDEPDRKMDIFKVYLTEATDLIRHRKVYLRRGYAYVPYKELMSVVVGRFRSNLSRALTAMSRSAEVIQEDARLAPILKAACGQNSTAQSKASVDSQQNITADMVQTLSSESFPPCMWMINKHLQKKHHLRHQGRMQFGLFLKSVGMSLEESMKFWKQAFTPVVDSEKFDKSYAYNIRHNYGKEGKRVDYTAYNCVKIITGTPPTASDCHGCPFKTMDSAILRQHLDNWGVRGEQQATIIELAQSNQYDRACSRYFESRHGIPIGDISQLISHPTQYFEESRKILAARIVID